MNLYLLRNFNNYFNRQVKKFDNLQDYLLYVGGVDGFYLLESSNFNPNDGVSTEHVFGNAKNPFDKDWQPDYCLVTDDKGAIISRWYVIEARRLMSKQYSITLKRDTAVDYYFQIISAPTYIEKAPLPDNDPLVVNNEGIQFNQIKTKEFFIKDETKIPWIVVYLNQNQRKFKTIEAVYTTNTYLDIDKPEFKELREFLGIDGDIKEAIRNDYVFDDDNFIYDYRYTWNCSQVFWLRTTVNTVRLNQEGYSTHWNNSTQEFTVGATGNMFQHEGSDLAAWSDGWWKMEEIAKRLGQAIKDHLNEFTDYYFDKIFEWKKFVGNKFHSSSYKIPSIIDKYSGQTFYSSSKQKFYTLATDVRDPQESVTNSTDFGEGKKLDSNFDFFDKYKGDIQGFSIQTPDQDKFYCEFKYKRYSYSLSEQTGASIKLDLLGTADESGHPKAFQSQVEPYDIICFPATDINVIDQNGNIVQCIGDSGYNIARAITAQLGQDNVYDVQIMPFCPCRELLNDEGIIDLRRAATNQYLKVYEAINPSHIVSYCLFSREPFIEFNTDVVYSHYYHDAIAIKISEALKLTNRKLQANCDMWRLTSPNFASSFEFNVAKCYPINESEQERFMTTFNIDVCFRPHNPYIHVNPNFGFLYGQDFNDSRGLICSGDFGLTVLSSAWIDYQVRNKNYQNIFDRSIQNMETNRQIAREQESWNVATTSVGAISGAIMGGVIGGALKGGAGGAVMGGVSKGLSGGMGIASSVKQRDWNERAYQEMRDFSVDQFNMQMDNIKALPNSITHTSSLTNNYKFFPLLEYYTCTDTEKAAFLEKIKYQGMTVGRIDRIANYIEIGENESFIKGKIIRLESVADDSHIAMDIYTEVDKGLFFVNNMEEQLKCRTKQK